MMEQVQVLNDDEKLVLVYLSEIKKRRQEDSTDAYTTAKELQIKRSSASTALDSLVQKGFARTFTDVPQEDYTRILPHYGFGISGRGERVVREERFDEARRKVGALMNLRDLQRAQQRP